MISHAGALITAFLFVLAGVYKAVDPYKFAALAQNLLVPQTLALPLALTLAVLETTSGVLVLIPRFRRWGAMLAGLLLLAFMGYIGWNYTALVGRDCSCFPELKLPLGLTIDMRRSVGPGFFYGDAGFLAAAAAAGIWAKKSYGLRNAAVILGAIAVFTGVSYGVVFTSQTGVKAPDTITVEGQPMSLQQGRIVLFFFDPFCGTCFAVGESMAKEKWKSDITVIGLPTTTPEAAPGYLRDSKLQAKLSPDSNKLRELWKFDAPPYLVLLENGRQIGGIQHHEFDEEHLDKHIALLRKMNVIE
ncbi:MAG: MauE/DoxX family redox-associated membrane protein [Acidobacteriota bacterium]